MELSNAGITTSYRYNVDGIRTGQSSATTATSYLVDSNRDYAQVLLELSGAGEVRYSYGDDLISQARSGATYYYHYDGLGSTRGLSDASGTITDSYDYEAFGEVLNQVGSTENSYLFAGEQFDSSLNQYYLRARYYDQGTGRFTQQDTWMGNNHDPITLHKYLYANADPANWTDPTGNFGLGGFGASISVQGVLTTASIGSSALNFYSAATDEYGLTAKEVGFSILIAAAGPAAGRLIKVFAKGSKAKKALSALENASENSFKAARNIKLWTPKNKHMLSTTSKSKGRFNTDDVSEIQDWVAEGLSSPPEQYFYQMKVCLVLSEL